MKKIFEVIKAVALVTFVGYDERNLERLQGL